MSKLVCGIGYNSCEFKSYENKNMLKEYKLWTDMLLRCTPKYWNKRPTYVGTTCSDNFKSYAYFYEWCNRQVGFNSRDGNGKRWHLDKDLLVKGNKVYSEDMCVFIPQEVNSLILNRKMGRGSFPVGVYLDKRWNKYVSICCIGKGDTKYLGSFDTSLEAFLVYKEAKESYIKQVAEQYKSQIDPRAYKALLEYEVNIDD